MCRARHLKRCLFVNLRISLRHACTWTCGQQSLPCWRGSLIIACAEILADFSGGVSPSCYMYI